MVPTNPDGQKHTRVNAHTPKWHCDDYVSLTSSGLDKNEQTET